MAKKRIVITKEGHGVCCDWGDTSYIERAGMIALAKLLAEIDTVDAFRATVQRDESSATATPTTQTSNGGRT